MYVNYDECLAAGLDPKKVERIASGISRYARQAEELNIQIFGGSGGELRFHDGVFEGALKVAALDGDYSGGDGADKDWGDGLHRGE